MELFNRKSLIAVISPLLVLSMASCQEKVEQSESSYESSTIDFSSVSSEEVITSIEIEGKSSVGIKEYVTLTAMANGNEQKVTWKSSNTSVATISSSGVVKGISKGTAVMTATLKTDNTITDTFEVTVTESVQLGKVFDRFIDSTYYKVTGTGNIATKTVTGSIAFEEEHFAKSSYLFSSSSDVCLPTYGLGVGKDGAYTYTVSNSQIASATYLRSVYSDLNDVIVDVTDLDYVGVNFSNIALAEDGIYDITNTTIMGFFFYVWSQNFNITNDQYDTLQQTLAKEMTSVTLTVVSPYEFKATLNFANLVTNAVLTFSNLNEDKSNTMLSTYLATNEVAYPEVYEDITKLKELAASHNYYRDFGNFKKTDGTQFNIGRASFTSDYVYHDYSDEYIEMMKDDPELAVKDYGYININGKKGYEDGVYEFTYEADETGEKKIILGDRWEDVNYQGETYKHWYDLYENISLIFQYMDGYEYTFSAASIDDEKYPESKFGIYLSTCVAAKTLCYEAFYTYIAGMNATQEGFILAISLDEDAPSNSVFNYAGYMSVSGSAGYVFSNYSYTGFGEGNVELLDNYLASLENA